MRRLSLSLLLFGACHCVRAQADTLSWGAPVADSLGALWTEANEALAAGDSTLAVVKRYAVLRQAVDQEDELRQLDGYALENVKRLVFWTYAALMPEAHPTDLEIRGDYVVYYNGVRLGESPEQLFGRLTWLYVEE